MKAEYSSVKNMQLLYRKYHSWKMSNIMGWIEVYRDGNGKVRVYFNDREKTHVKQEFFNAIGIVFKDDEKI